MPITLIPDCLPAMGYSLPSGQAARFSCVGQQVTWHQRLLSCVIDTSYQSHSMCV